MHKQKHTPKLIAVADKHGDALLTPGAAWERLHEERRERDAHCFRHPKPVVDFVEPRRPVDAPMATRDTAPAPMSRWVGVLFLAILSFMAGLMVGKSLL